MRAQTTSSRFRALLNLKATSMSVNINNNVLLLQPFSFEDTIQYLKNAADTKNLIFGKIIHAHLITSSQLNEQSNNVVLMNSLINFYSKCGEIRVAQNLFDEMPQRNIVSWSSLMMGFLQTGGGFQVLKLFRNMGLVDGIRPNEYILSTALSACKGMLFEGQQCHCLGLKSGLVFYQYVKNALVRMYSMCSDLGGAMGVLYSIPGSDIVTYNSIISGLLDHGYMNEALGVLNRIVAEYKAWDEVTYINIFALCARIKDANMGMQVHNHLLKNSGEFGFYVTSSLMDMYGKCGKISYARKVFDSLNTRNVGSWTTIMAAYLQNDCFEETLSLFLDMELEDVEPNDYTFAVVLNASASLSALGYGTSLHAYTEKLGFKGHVIVGNALINMYSKAGFVGHANKVFTEMINRDIISWNSIISAYCHHGLGNEALSLFNDMLAAKIKPNNITFVGVLSACGHLGQVQEGFYYLQQLMNQMGIEPGLEHYTCIVGLLSKAGLLLEAENFIRFTLVNWDVVAWRTLLNACHVHKNYDLGKQIANIVLQMYPDDVGTYTLLSNMHAKAKRWDGVANIRKLMRERNIKKEPGLSWTEIRNNTCVFVSDDKSHPELKQIHEKVKDLLNKITLLGYVPDIATVFHDVEAEQKEEYLSFHSEKLAIAYALLKTPPDAPIRVIKNLRMCSDCHSAIKLISKVTNRLIIVRDVNRFHSFRDGNCSCQDYW
ncbi:hypothetical protein DCAR_0518664 [Daucus carota subsp. sativus]|uniref:DYW domain-containing protein n=1 Tax=Daucus carota subsp. sativus TaxID=79200 RepID=A0AAF1B0G3_DAUCS|nr:PREDICTED: pentatricopeptide repeat-containing protein At5g39680 [Daucus carota subsp. sativus]WOG99316.1 hypothetical protein DCAR_0518664 [Daucus carota subsp. sativus]